MCYGCWDVRWVHDASTHCVLLKAWLPQEISQKYIQPLEFM